MKSLSGQMNKGTKRGQDYHSGAHSTQPQAYHLCLNCTTPYHNITVPLYQSCEMSILLHGAQSSDQILP